MTILRFRGNHPVNNAWLAGASAQESAKVLDSAHSIVDVEVDLSQSRRLSNDEVKIVRGNHGETHITHVAELDVLDAMRHVGYAFVARNPKTTASQQYAADMKELLGL